jgi:hypothetical protein
MYGKTARYIRARGQSVGEMLKDLPKSKAACASIAVMILLKDNAALDVGKPVWH